MKMWHVLIFILSENIFIALTHQQNDSEAIRKSQSGFIFTMPKTLLSNQNETVCVTTHYTTPPSKIIVDLKMKEKHFFTTKILQLDHECFEMYVPSDDSKEPQFASIHVQIQLNGVVHSAHNQDPILVYPNKQLTFIETDRGIYKFGDKIKIRILVLLNNLLPPNNYKITEVRVKNPLDISVYVWENVITELGLAQLEHELSQDAIRGKWKIEVNGIQSITFQVNKYILPRFKIELFHPKIVYIEDASINIKVCAKYSYGRNVKGNAFIRLTDWHHNLQDLQNIKETVEGCANFTFTKQQLSFNRIKNKFSLYDPKINIHITSTITEYGTDKIELTTGKILISMKPFNVKFVTESYFQPGLPYSGKLQFSNIYANLSKEVIEICYNVAVRRSWNYLKNEQCSNFTVGEDNTVQFHVLPMKSNIIHLHLNARSLNNTNIGDSFLAVRLYSPSNSYIYLEQTNPENTKCKSTHNFTVQYTTDKLIEHENITFYYMIKTRNQIYKLTKINHIVRKHYSNYLNDFTDIIGQKHKYIKLGSAVDKFVLKIELDVGIISKYQLFVYYITDNGETVGTTKEIEVEPCLNNKVKATWSKKETNPGGRATLEIKTSSDSLCSVSAIDKSTKFFGHSQNMNINNLVKAFMQEREIPTTGRKSCIAPVKNKNRGASAATLVDVDSMWDLRRKKRFVYPFSEDFDTYDTINKFGVIIISNFKIVTKPCYTGPVTEPNVNHSVQFLTDQYDIQNDEKNVPIRYYFPETWLWELIPVKSSNVTNIQRYLPHTITNWVTNVMCVSGTEGVGFSETTEISGFQPFFVDALTPYSIKNGETMYLHVILFNYLNYSLPIRISLGESKGLKIVDASSSKSISYCLIGNTTIAHIFELKAIEIGKTNITILAELDSVYPGQCGPDVIVNKRDVVFKSLLVEPEGYPIQVTKSALICASDTANNVTWDMKIPDKVVANTIKTKIVLNGDLLGQVIENLEDLITMPTGCGEQIMSSLAPNLFILRYLNATKNLTPSLQQRIKRNLKIGYQRILNYAHKSGSFSAFGYHDPSGSTFLTAFVVRTLQEAKRFIYVDERIIEKAVSWIFANQLENGCFNTMLHVFQDMGGASTENSTAALTSYVIISLLEANVDIPDSIKTNAKYCMRGQYHLDKYTLAISSYALFKVGWYYEADLMLKKLFQLAHQQENMLWWSNKANSESTATDVEITSYVLLALLYNPTSENLAKAHSIVHWLSTKRGSHGGFKSTQDTVVALDALAKYSAYITSRKINMEVKVNALKQSHIIKIKEEDKLKSKRIILKENNNKIEINVNGEGCVLAQVVQNYYLIELPKNKAFKLDLEISPVSTIDQCSIATLSSCLAYDGPDSQSNMAVLEVNLPSGYQADRASLFKLVDPDSEQTSRVKMFEEIDNQIVLYFTKVDQQRFCIDFNINEYAMVESKSNSIIKLYDYYKPEYEVVQFYKMKMKCDEGNQTIPDVNKNITNKNKSEIGKNLVKRNLMVNPDFVDMDFELAVPTGNEGNVPMYTTDDLKYISTINNTIK